MRLQGSNDTGETAGNLTIGEDVKIVGHIVVPGLAIINGTLEGELQADELLVGIKGSLTGQVKVKTADIHGKTFDTITASEFLCVRSTGKVNGQAYYGEIEIEKGGAIEGTVTPVSSNDRSKSFSKPASKESSEDTGQFGQST